MEIPETPRDEFHVWDFPADGLYITPKTAARAELLEIVGKKTVNKTFATWAFKKWSKNTAIKFNNYIKLADLAGKDHKYVERTIKCIKKAVGNCAVGKKLHLNEHIKLNERVVRMITYIMCNHGRGRYTDYVAHRQDMAYILEEDIKETLGALRPPLDITPLEVGYCTGCKRAKNRSTIGEKCQKCGTIIETRHDRNIAIPAILKDILALWIEKYEGEKAKDVIQQIEKGDRFIPAMCLEKKHRETCLKAICDSTLNASGDKIEFRYGKGLGRTFKDLLKEFGVEYRTHTLPYRFIIGSAVHIARFGRWGDLSLDSKENKDVVVRILRYYDEKKKLICVNDDTKLKYNTKKKIAFCPKCGREYPLVETVVKRIKTMSAERSSGGGWFCWYCKHVLIPNKDHIDCPVCGVRNVIKG